MRSDFKDSADTINKMIQFGTVKYGIVKQLKDRSRSERDVTSDQEENGSPPISCSPVLNCKSISPEVQQTMFDHQNEDHNHNNNISSEIHDDDRRYVISNSSPVKSEHIETYPDIGTNHRISSSPLVNQKQHSEEREGDEEVENEIRLREQRQNSTQQSPSRVTRAASISVTSFVHNHEEDHNMSDVEDDRVHSIIHESNIGENREQDRLQLHHNPHLHSLHTKTDSHNSTENISIGNELSSSPPTLPQFPAAPVTLEAIQNMQMAIAQFAAKTLANGGADNEAAMKQLAFLQQTLFNLQQQQLFQIQLIQQLQSQLAMNQMKEGDDGNQEQTEEDDGIDEEDQHCIEISSNQNPEEQNNKDTSESMDVETHESHESEKKSENSDEHTKGESDLLHHEQQQELKIQQEQKLQQDKEVQKEQLQQQIRQEEQKLEETRKMQKDLLLSLPKQDENTPLPFGSDLASSIITNHDDPPSLDEPNSLEMLQKRAQEVLESASQGILAGNLADEFAFGKDKSGDGKNRNEPFFKHRCRYCGKVFGSDSALQIHIRSHTGERPFKCNVCGSRFTTKGNLKVHFQRHAQKFPHVPMNATPIPEHLDKFHPPLLEQMSPETSPQHQPQMPHPNVPVSLPLPFPPGAGFPGLPLYRPPLEILKTLGTPYPTPFFGPAMPPLPPKRDQEMPTDLRKPIVTPVSPKVKEETKDEPKSLRVKEEEENESANSTPRRSKSVTPPLPPPLPEIQQQQQPQSQERPQLQHQRHQHHQLPPPPSVSLPEPIPQLPQMPSGPPHIPPSLSREEMQDRLPLNFARSSPERRSPIRSPASIPRSPFLGPLKHEMALIPRPHSNDNSWENFIEVSNTSETVKLKELMKNKKLTDPNQCVVCDRVLSCKSALQMHYRTHTGERPFKCRICGRAFTTKGNLKTHMAVHKIRPPMRNFHQCPVCHKKYSNALVLQQHIRLHTGEPTDLTPEQIQAAEIRDFPPSMMPGSFLNPFAFNFGMPGQNGTLGSESSQGDNDDNMDCSDDFDDDISDHLSNGGDSDRPKSGDEMKGMLFEQKLKIENNRPKSEASTSSAPTSPISAMNKSSPAPSDISQGALDLTPRSITSIPQPLPPNPALIPTRPPFGMFPNIPLFPPVSTTTQNMCSAMNSIAQSVMPSAPFNPLALSGVRGSTTCGICFKTFPCHSALEIHYRSHTKERPFKCNICDRGFTTKGNLKQHMLTHKIRDMEQDAYRNRAVKYMSGWKEGFE